MEDYQKKIAKILRVSASLIVKMEDSLSRKTGRVGIIKKIMADNDELAKDRLLALGVSMEAHAHDVYDALISKVESDDVMLLKKIGHKGLGGFAASQKVCKFVAKIHEPNKGFFLKKSKAEEFLMNEPPRMIMKALGYGKVEELIAKEDLLEVYSALRFLEETEWQNNVFFKQYESLKPSDFEVRRIELRALNEKWAKAAEKFVAKKYHNVSHLKELGVIFVIPIFLGISGETLRLVSLLLHYLNEISYYSDIVKSRFATNEATFAKNVISVLRGDVPEERLGKPPGDAFRFLVVQRYLAKDDENDWRLFEPHINPEARHWVRAENDILKIDDALRFWSGMDWTGEFFKDEAGVEVLVSFDLVDTVMNLVKREELIKYLYHHQEALWNEIFTRYYSEEKLDDLSKRFIVKGWFEI